MLYDRDIMQLKKYTTRLLYSQPIRALFDLIEDFLDESAAKKASKEKKGKGIPLEEIMRKYL